MNIDNFESIQKITSNNKNTEDIILPETKKEGGGNRYLRWQAIETRQMLNNNMLDSFTANDLGKLDYIKYAIEEGNDDDLDLAMVFAREDYVDYDYLLVDIYRRKGDYESAKELILQTKPGFYEPMSGSVERLLKNNPEKREELMNEIKEKNNDFFKTLRVELYISENKID